MPPHAKSFSRIFYTGDIIRVTSFRGANRKWDISWLAVVVAHKPPEREPWFTPEGLAGPLRIIWISGEDDKENFNNYFNGSPRNPKYCLNPHRSYIDHLNPNDSRIRVQLIDRVAKDD